MGWPPYPHPCVLVQLDLSCGIRQLIDPHCTIGLLYLPFKENLLPGLLISLVRKNNPTLMNGSAFPALQGISEE